MRTYLGFKKSRVVFAPPLILRSGRVVLFASVHRPGLHALVGVRVLRNGRAGVVHERSAKGGAALWEMQPAHAAQLLGRRARRPCELALGDDEAGA